MANQLGSFTIENKTKGTITFVTGQHIASGHPTDTLTVSSLAAGDTTGKQAFETDTHSRDLWEVSFVNSDGELRTGHKFCGYEESDGNANVIILLQDDDFTIMPPVSSSCPDASYDQTAVDSRSKAERSP
jgi:hypothetical protein